MFKSSGLKRTLVAYLAVVADVLRVVPGTEPILAVIDALIGLLGGAALAHAGASKTLSKEKLAGAVAALYALIAIAPWFPPLVPFLPFLYKAAGVLSAVRVGQGVVGGSDV